LKFLSYNNISTNKQKKRHQNKKKPKYFRSVAIVTKSMAKKKPFKFCKERKNLIMAKKYQLKINKSALSTNNKISLNPYDFFYYFCSLVLTPQKFSVLCKNIKNTKA